MARPSCKRRGGLPSRTATNNILTLLLLTLALIYFNWSYQGVKRRVEAERIKQHATAHAGAAAAASTSGAVQAGVLYSWGLDANLRLGRGGDGEEPRPALEELEVVGVAASRHSLVVTRDGTVWSMGANDSSGGGGHGSKALRASGQLGRDGGWAPGPVFGALQGQRVVHVAAGRYHSVAVTDTGRVYTWGLNDYGQLGRTGRSEEGAASATAAAAAQAGQPSVLLTPPASGHSAAATGETGGAVQSEHVLPAAADGTGSGRTSSGGCTSGWSCHDGAPGVVEALLNVTAVGVRAGRYSTVLLDSMGRLWVWGYDGCASNGKLPVQHEMWRPRLVQGKLKGRRVVAFDVGYTFWLAATHEGALFSCDTQDDGYAGTLPGVRSPNNAGQLGRSGPPHEPGQVLGALQHQVVEAVAAGREHALVATAAGEVYSFGGGRAVLGREGPRNEPGLVAGALNGLAVKHVAAGEYFSLAATANTVFGWGSNAYLCTGTGQPRQKEILEPQPVAGMLGAGKLGVHALAAGYQHAFTIASRTRPATAVSKAVSGAQVAQLTTPTHAAFAPVQVVLTEDQKQAQQQYQQQLGKQEQQQQVEASQGEAVAVGPGADTTSSSSSSSGGSSSSSGGSSSNSDSKQGLELPADQRWSYLALQPAPSRRNASEVWASWTPSPWRDALAALSPDVFTLLPKQYNAQHKNPCFGGTGPQLACLPYFNIIGVSKCGTTDLYHRLTLYKQVILPATNKGPHFWDECPFPPQGACQAGPSGDFKAYINLFSRAADLIRMRPTAITGEASSNTFTAANGIYVRGFKGDTPVAEWAGALGANATIPALLREAQPYLRLILMLRNPVSRYYSAFHYYRWWLKGDKPPTADDFHQVALKEVAQWRQCVAARGVDQCLRHFQPQQLIKGMYAKFLPDWLRHFPREQLLILRYEDYIVALPQHLKAVLTFLGVPEPDPATLQAMAAAEVQNRKQKPPMRQDTRQLLEAFYAPFNQKLAAMLGGDERWTWS